MPMPLSPPSPPPSELLVPEVSTTSFAELDAEGGAIGADGDGNVWFAGGRGLARFDGTALTRFLLPDGLAVLGIAPGPAGIVYIATRAGLLRHSAEGLRLYRGLCVSHAGHLRSGPDGRAYLVVTEQAAPAHVRVFDGEVQRVLRPGVDFPPGLEPSCVGFDAHGALVFGLNGGLAFQRDDGWTVIKGLDPAAAFAPHVHDIASDADGLWLASQQGVYEYRRGTFALHRTPTAARCLCVDGDQVWVGLDHGGLGRLSAGALEVVLPGSSALPHEDVTGLARAADGRIWIQAGGKIAFIRDREIERPTT